MKKVIFELPDDTVVLSFTSVRMIQVDRTKEGYVNVANGGAALSAKNTLVIAAVKEDGPRSGLDFKVYPVEDDSRIS